MLGTAVGDPSGANGQGLGIGGAAVTLLLLFFLRKVLNLNEKAFKKFRRLVRFKDSIICMVIINLAIYYLPLLLSFRVTESFLLSLSLPRSKRKRE